MAGSRLLFNIMSIRKIDSSFWVDFRFDGKRYRKRCPENSHMGARAYEAVLRKRLARGEPIDRMETPAEYAFEEFVPHWFETYVKTNNKPSEQKTKQVVLRVHLLPWFGKKKLSAINAEQIERYKASRLLRYLSAKTINNHLTILRTCLSSAVEWGQLKNLPKVSLLNTIPPDRDFLTVEEGVRLVNATDDPMWNTMILLALRTGMRFGEMCGLEWVNVNMELEVITVRRSIVDGVVSSPKNHQQRFVPFPRSVAEALRRLPKRGELVFSRVDGQPLSHRIAERAIHRACAAAGLRRVGWHTLRHSCASQLGMLRGSLLEAQRLLGHSTLEMTERYTHIVPALLHQAVSDLDDAALKSSVVWAAGGQGNQNIVTN